VPDDTQDSAPYESAANAKVDAFIENWRGKDGGERAWKNFLCPLEFIRGRFSCRVLGGLG